MRRSITLSMFAFVCSSTASLAQTTCPIYPTPESLLQGQQTLLDPTTGQAWSGSADNFPYGHIAIGGRMKSAYGCDRLTVQYEIRRIDDPLAGVSTAMSTACRGACDHNTSLDLPPLKSYAWQWRTKIESFCFNGNGQCAPDPAIVSYTGWHAGPPFRHWGSWTPQPGADHTISELAIIHGQQLGEESEDKRAKQQDGVYMNFGAVPLPGTKKYVVEFLAPVDFLDEHQIDGVLRTVTMADADCDEVIEADSFAEQKKVQVTLAHLKGKNPSVRETFLPDLSGWLSPKIGEFSGARTVGLYFTCTGDRPFTYGTDFFSIQSRELTAK